MSARRPRGLGCPSRSLATSARTRLIARRAVARRWRSPFAAATKLRLGTDLNNGSKGGRTPHGGIERSEGESETASHRGKSCSPSLTPEETHTDPREDCPNDPVNPDLRARVGPLDRKA